MSSSSDSTAQLVQPCTLLSDYGDDAIVSKQDLAHTFSVSVKTVDRMVRRGELPPPGCLGGKNVWMVGRIRHWLNRLMEKREKEAWAIVEKMERFSL